MYAGRRGYDTRFTAMQSRRPLFQYESCHPESNGAFPLDSGSAKARRSTRYPIEP